MEIGWMESSGTLLNISETNKKYYKTRSDIQGKPDQFFGKLIIHEAAHTFCDFSSEMRQEKLLKTLHINQTCKKYYHIYTPVPAPIPNQ